MTHSPLRTGIAAAALALATSAVAQAPTILDEPRRAARAVFVTGVVRPAEVCIDYAPAPWRQAHAAEVTRGRAATFPLGNGFWSTLHNTAALRLGSRRLPPGTWYLALQRSAEAQWALAVIAPSKVRQQGLQPGGAARVRQPDVLLPMQLTSDLEVQDELRIAFERRPDDETPGALLLRLRWGPHELLATVDLDVEVAGEVAHPGFAALDADVAVETASGLRYQELRACAGALPGPESKVRVHYVGWLTDGTKFDSSLDRGQSVAFPLNGVIKGWTEGLQLMRPGARMLLEIPSDLGYGDRGAPPTIPPGATLIFWVELLAVE